MFSGYAFWLILGLLLMISEFVAPGLIAFFFGVGALMVGALTFFGVVSDPAWQLLLFSLISLVALFGLRRHFHRWMRGSVANQSQGEMADSQLGARVSVLHDFQFGAGQVQFRGAKWDAESGDALAVGDTAWITGSRGLILLVSAKKPEVQSA